MLSSRTSYNFNLFQFGNKKKKQEKSRHLKLQGKTTNYNFLLNHHTSFCVLPCSSKHTKKVVCIVQLPSLQKRSKIDFLIFLERPAKPNSGTNLFGRQAPSWLVSSIGRALHRYRRGHGFKSRMGLKFFSGPTYNYQFQQCSQLRGSSNFMFGRLLGKADDIWRSDSISHSYLSLTMKHLRRLQSLALNSDRTLDYLIQNLCSIHLQIVSRHYL